MNEKSRYIKSIAYVNCLCSQDVEEIIGLAKSKNIPVHFGTKSDLGRISNGRSHQVLTLIPFQYVLIPAPFRTCALWPDQSP